MKPAWMDWPQTQKLIAAFSAKGDCLRFVGGAVRDALLDRKVQDVDAATILLPEETMALLGKSGIRAIPTGIAHGTVTALIDGRHFEITTLRRDVATDGRHAKVEYTDDWKADAARRDFTMNALYLSPVGELFDYSGGETDAKEGRVRFIGDPGARIAEDYLRILRFFRFHAHYGKGAPDAAALAACSAQASHMESLSGERVHYELFKLLAAPAAATTIEIMHTHHVLQHALGFSVHDVAMLARMENISRVNNVSIEPAIKLAAFIVRADHAADALAKISTRLRLSSASQKMLEAALEYSVQINISWTEAEQKKLLRKLGSADFSNAVAIAWAQGNEPVTAAHSYAKMLQLAAQWQPPIFPVNGNDLIALGIAPGKEMGEKLRALEAFWEAQNYTPDKQALLARIKN